jgi:hypothetical protein
LNAANSKHRAQIKQKEGVSGLMVEEAKRTHKRTNEHNTYIGDGYVEVAGFDLH